MLISTDYKKIFLAVPKTGTRSIQHNIHIENRCGIQLGGEHEKYLKAIETAKNGVKNFDEEGLEKVYLFWRDPVQRFISSVNHVRSQRFLTFAISYRPQWFPEVDLSKYRNNLPPMEEIPPFPPEIFDIKRSRELDEYCTRAALRITPEEIFRDKELMTSSIFFMKQSLWHENIPNNKKIVMDFSNFEENARKLVIDFGATQTKFHKINIGITITNRLSPSLEEEVRAYYAEDYALKP